MIIPAFNEERRLPRTLATVVEHLASRPWSSTVVVVDNNSADRTAETVEQFRAADVPVFVIGCSRPGKGAAVRRGILTSSARFIGFVDADNSTPITTLDEAMALLHEGCDAVVASRRSPGSQYVVEQSPLRQGGRWLYRRIAGRILESFSDTQCGFKFFDGPVAREIAQSCTIDGFAFDVELLALLVRTGHIVAEVPVAWSDMPGSTFSAWRDGLRSLTDVALITRSSSERARRRW
ncbi:MAG: glycosyltransferase [Solirubrobacteraceae bacterium]